jgi:hypothetical protein
MRRTTAKLAALAACLVAAAPGVAAAATPTHSNWETGFGPGQYGTGAASLSYATSTADAVKAGGLVAYTASSCEYCNTTLLGQANVQYDGTSDSGIFLSAQSSSPLPNHAASFQYTAGGGPSWSWQ